MLAPGYWKVAGDIRVVIDVNRKGMCKNSKSRIKVERYKVGGEKQAETLGLSRHLCICIKKEEMKAGCVRLELEWKLHC